MTVLAWDGTTFAADKLCCNGSTKKTVTKIFKSHCKIDGSITLLGITGNVSIGMEMVSWYERGAVDSEYPQSNRQEDRGCSLVVIDKDNVRVYESSPDPFVIEGKFCAFGCGEEAALAAMECGANAARAVEVVCMYNNGCGNGIDTLTL